MSTDIPQWVRIACGKWGHQKRRIWTGKDWHGNVDGYAQSLLGRIRDEREGAGQGQRAQHWAEVFWGDGLDVQRVLLGMPERSYCALHMQYVWDPEWGVTANRKARAMELSRAEYFNSVDRAETWIHARLEVRRPDSQMPRIVEEIVSEALQTAQASVTRAHPGGSVPALNLAALGRSPLRLKN